MRRNRLPLTALRSFEAAGRHMSFSLAAAELLVSQAAISRQIRDLETILGTRLFERRHRGVAFTADGAALHAEIASSFDAIDRSLSALLSRRADAATVLRVSVEPSLAATWLVPRLDRFRAMHPDIDVALEVDARLIAFQRHEPALAVRFAETQTAWDGSDCALLAEVGDTPVLSPALLQAQGPLRTPHDLQRFTLLHEETRSGWNRWFRAAGLTDVAFAARGPMLADAALSRQAALLGHGVALGDLLLVHEQLKSGALIRPFPVTAACGRYFLVARDLSRLGAPERAFAQWISAEFAASLAALRQDGLL